MNRLTKKIGENVYANNINRDAYTNNDDLEDACINKTNEVYTKLGQLEDKEEGLGIELLTLLTALKNGIFTYEGYIPAEDLVVWKGQLYHKPLMNAFHIDIFMFDDYGTRWALTKEELENE